jgi:hypothetical protein
VEIYWKTRFSRVKGTEEGGRKFLQNVSNAQDFNMVLCPEANIIKKVKGKGVPLHTMNAP